MKKPNAIQILNPCHEDWEKMIPEVQGRFCASCAAVVSDFSQMTDTQIVAYFKNHKDQSCGRFTQDQLNRPLVPLETQGIRFWRQAWVWLAMFFVGLPKIASQPRKQKVVSSFSKSIQENLETVEFVLVDSKSGQKITEARVVINNSDSLLTDSIGTFSIRISKLTDQKKISIQLNRVGYALVEFKSDIADLDVTNIIEMDQIEMQAIQKSIPLSISASVQPNNETMDTLQEIQMPTINIHGSTIKGAMGIVYIDACEKCKIDFLVFNEDAEPLTDAAVSFLSKSGNQVSGTTDSFGRLQLALNPNDKYHGVFIAEGYLNFEMGEIVFNPGINNPVKIRMLQEIKVRVIKVVGKMKAPK